MVRRTEQGEEYPHARNGKKKVRDKTRKFHPAMLRKQRGQQRKWFLSSFPSPEHGSCWQGCI